MKMRWTMGMLLGALALGTGCGGGQAARASQLATVDGDADAAAPVFAANCAGCHGPEGRGKKGSPDLTSDHVRGMSKEKIARVILGGDGPMPGFADKLDDAQVASLIAWIKRGPTQD